MAQSLVGKDSLVSDVYPMHSSKQFVSTLEDNLRFRGAMSKLISDYAQVEISNKVKDILRCTTAVVGILNLITRITILQNGIIQPSKHRLTPSSTGLEHFLSVGYFALAMCVTYSITSLVNSPR